MGVSKSVGSCRGAGQRCEGLNGARRRHVRDTVKAKVTEFSCRSEAGDWLPPSHMKVPVWKDPGLQNKAEFESRLDFICRMG